jgi:hypothetical protein
MGLIFAIGFEIGTLPQRTNALEFTNAQIGTAVVHTGSYCLQNNTNSVGAGMKVFINHASGLNLTIDELYWSMWVYREATNASTITITLSDGNYIQFKTNGTSPFYWDAYVNTTKVASGAVAMSTNAWNLFEFHVKIADAGTIESRMNGTADISYSGDTKPGSSTTISYVDQNIVASGTSSGQRVHIDDYALGTGGWLGDIRIEKLVPTANSTANWTASTGSQYQCIDEVPASDTDYISSSTNSQRNTSDFTDFTGTGKTVAALIHWIRVKKDPANSQKVKDLVVLGANETLGAALTLTGSYQHFATIHAAKPGGGSWSDSDVDSVVAGVEANI